MADLVDLNAQELARLHSIFGETIDTVNHVKRLRNRMADLLRNMDRNNGLLPDDRTGTSYLTDDLSAPARQEYNRARNVMEDLFATVNNGEDISGTAHTRNTTDDTQLTTHLDDFFSKRLV